MEKVIGVRLREARERKGLTQKKVAKLVGVSLPTFARYEKGETMPTADFIAAFASVTKTDPTWLVLGIESNAHAKLEAIQSVLDASVDVRALILALKEAEDSRPSAAVQSALDQLGKSQQPDADRSEDSAGGNEQAVGGEPR